MTEEQSILNQGYGRGNQPRHITGDTHTHVFHLMYQVLPTTPAASERLAELSVPIVDIQRTLDALRGMGVPTPVLQQLRHELNVINRSQLTTNINLRAILGQIETVENKLNEHRRQFLEKYKKRGVELTTERTAKETALSEHRLLQKAYEHLQKDYETLQKERARLLDMSTAASTELKEKETQIQKLLNEDLAQATQDLAQATTENTTLKQMLACSGNDYSGKVTFAYKNVYLDLEHPLMGGFQRPKITIGIQRGNAVSDNGLTIYALQRSRSKYNQSFGIGFHTNFQKLDLLTTGEVYIPDFGHGSLHFKLPITDHEKGWELYSVYAATKTPEVAPEAQMKLSTRVFPWQKHERTAPVRRPQDDVHHKAFALVSATVTPTQPVLPDKMPMMAAILLVGMLIVRFFQKNTYNEDALM